MIVFITCKKMGLESLSQYDPLYGARPLRRAIMRYLEDTLAEQCLSKNLYPDTKIILRRKKVESTLMTYTNELEIEIDFSDVDSSLLTASDEKYITGKTIENKDIKSENESLPKSDSDINNPVFNFGKDEAENKTKDQARQFSIAN